MIVDQSEGRGQIGFPVRHDTGLKKWKNNKYIGPKGKKTTWKQLLIKPKKKTKFSLSHAETQTYIVENTQDENQGK